MRVKVGLTGRERQSKEEKKTKTLGAIIPGSVLAAAVLFLFIIFFLTLSICFSAPHAWVQYQLTDCLCHQI